MQITWNDADLTLRLINGLLEAGGPPEREEQARKLGGQILGAFPGVFSEMFPHLKAK